MGTLSERSFLEKVRAGHRRLGDLRMEREAAIQKVLEFAKSCQYEAEHSHQDAKLALKLFDELRPLHGLGDEERLWLECAAFLHDIGWLKGKTEHHKTARDMIVGSDIPFSDREKVMIALIARYHRRALPKETHKYYSDLNGPDKERVKKAAALLRIADGLDRGHNSAVKDLSCKVIGDTIVIKTYSEKDAGLEKEFGKIKADLFEEVFKKQVTFE